MHRRHYLQLKKEENRHSCAIVFRLCGRKAETEISNFKIWIRNSLSRLLKSSGKNPRWHSSLWHHQQRARRLTMASTTQTLSHGALNNKPSGRPSAADNLFTCLAASCFHFGRRSGNPSLSRPFSVHLLLSLAASSHLTQPPHNHLRFVLSATSNLISCVTISWCWLVFHVTALLTCRSLFLKQVSGTVSGGRKTVQGRKKITF